MKLLLNNCLAVLNDIGRWFCSYSTEIFIQSGILIILLLIVDFLLRKRIRATFRYWIWMLVLLKLILPPAFSLPTGIGHWFGDYIPAHASVTKQVSNTIWSKPAGASAPQDSNVLGTNPQVHLSQTSPETAAPAISVNSSDSQPLTMQAVVFAFWLIGAAALSILPVQQIFRFRSVNLEYLKRIAVEYRRFKVVFLRTSHSNQMLIPMYRLRRLEHSQLKISGIKR